MERRLKEWINEFRRANNQLPPSSMVKAKAQELCRFKEVFKASKGWFEKFAQRHFPNEVFGAGTEKKDLASFKFATPQRDINFSIDRIHENDSLIHMTLEQRIKREVRDYHCSALQIPDSNDEAKSRRRLMY